MGAVETFFREWFTVPDSPTPGPGLVSQVVRLAEADPNPDKAKKTARDVAIAAAILLRRRKLHTTHGDPSPLVAQLVRHVTPGMLAALMTPGAAYKANRGAVLDLLQRQYVTTDGLPSAWRAVMTTAQADAAAEGAAAARFAAEGGSLTQHAADAKTVLDTPWAGAQSWVDLQLQGLAGDVARAYGDGTTTTVDTDIENALTAGAGPEIYLDTELSDAYVQGSLATYTALQVAWVDWTTAGDAAVEGMCLGYAAQNPYPAGDPPFMPAHPGCRCVYLPALPPEQS